MSLTIGTGITIGAGVTIAPKHSVVTDGLKLYLDSGDTASYPGTGSTWYDLSGEGYTTDIFGGMTYSSNDGGVFTFDGSNTGYAQVPAGFDYDYSAGFTVNVWANFTTGGGTWERLIDFGNGPGGPTGYNLIMANNGITPGSLIMSINGNNDDVSGTLDPGEMPITFDGWAMYTIFCDGTFWKQYKNGSFYSYKSAAELPATVTRTLNYIGKSNWESDAYFLGSMSVVQLYNRALSEAEITQTFNYFKSRYGL